MVNTLPRAGIDSWVLWGAESTYGTAATTINQHFGIVQSVTPSSRRNLQHIRGFVGSTTSGRNMVKALGGKFETSLTIDFQPQHFTWFKYVIGTVTGLGTATDKYIYCETVSGTTTSTSASKLVCATGTFDATHDTLIGARVLNTTSGSEAQTTVTAVDNTTTLTVADDIFPTGRAFTILADTLSSMTVATSIELGTTDRNWRYLGLKVNSCTIRSAVGEPVSVSLDLVGADVDQSTTLEAATALDTNDVYNFSGSTFEMPNASTISNIIDSVEITITNNVEVLYGLGTFVGKNARAKAREYSIRLSCKTYDNKFSTFFLGNATDVAAPTETATAEINLTGGTNHTAALLFTNVTLEDWADSQTHPDVIPEEFTMVAESMQLSEQQSA